VDPPEPSNPAKVAMATEISFPSSPAPRDDSVRSLWLEQALGSESAGAVRELHGAAGADVCIVGGGYAGLWTALMLKADDPSLDVAVVEGDVCGGGASGRNGGFVMSWWSKFSTLKKLCGEEEALRLARASAESVREIGRFCEANGIDAEYHYGGWLWTATSPAQEGAWEATISAIAASGESVFERLTPDDVGRRASSAAHLAGVFEPYCATVHPARLARGLARVAREQGVRVYERSPVASIELGPVCSVRTSDGSLAAERVVLAINAWSAQLKEFKRALIVVASDVIATPPIALRLAEIGWTDGVAISDSRRLVNYYRRTDDGRVVFGKGGGTLEWAGRVGPSFHRASPRAKEVEHHFHRLYPALADVAPDRSWRGPIDYSLSGMPSFVRVDGRPNVIAVAGFSGNGVGPTHLAARILSSIVLEKDDEWAGTALARTRAKTLPPEPICHLGGLAVRTAIARKEMLEDAGRAPGRLTAAIAKLDPTSFVDRGNATAGEHRPAKVTD
jgi:putative aminophosphonate oxidoreductase